VWAAPLGNLVIAVTVPPFYLVAPLSKKKAVRGHQPPSRSGIMGASSM